MKLGPISRAESRRRPLGILCFARIACCGNLRVRSRTASLVRRGRSIIDDRYADGQLVEGVARDKNESYLAVMLTNRGTAATTITHMFLVEYPNWFAKWIPSFLTRRMKHFRKKTLWIP